MGEAQAQPNGDGPTGRIVTLYDLDGSAVSISVEDTSRVLHAWRQWAERRIDALVEVESRGGATYTVLASRIGTLFDSTAESRARGTHQERANTEEIETNRVAAGYPAHIPGDE